MLTVAGADSGSQPVLVGIGPATADVFGGAGSLRAAAFRVGRSRAQLMGATELRWRNALFRAARPVDIEVAADGTATIEVARETGMLFAPGPQLTIDGRTTGKYLSI